MANDALVVLLFGPLAAKGGAVTDPDACGPTPDPAGEPDAVRQTFEQMPMIMGGFHGARHVFDATNAAYRAWMGRENVIGQAAPDVFPELVGQELFAMFDRVTETGEASFQKEWRFQADLTDSGELQEFFMDLTVGPRRDPAGSVTGLTLWGVNVTERVRERQAAQRVTAEAEQRYRAARDVVIGLQRALLPAAVPVLAGVDVAARYLVASRDQAAGGDWFDVVPLSDGSVAAVVGDIVGHGVAASSAMGQLRSVLSTALHETADLALSLGWADRMAARSPVMRAATVCVAVLDPATGIVCYATCGHPPPLVVTPAGTTRFLLASGGGPLGTGSSRAIVEDVLHPGEVLLLYTDGLIEQPGLGMAEGRATLARVAGNATGNRVMPLDARASTVERVCQQSVEMLTRLGYDDDVTTLALQRRPNPVEALRCQLPATPAAVTEIRSALRDWFTALNLLPTDEQAIELAVTELVANAVEHAYPPTHPGPVRLRADLGADGVLTIGVGDDGTWREPVGPKDLSGRGLWMAGAALDQLNLHHSVGGGVDGSTGTVVTIRHQLRRPATLASQPTNPAPRKLSMPFAVQLDHGPPPALRVCGPLDIVTAALFADRLDSASRGGLHPVAIDLSQVDILSSAGVRVLFQARDEHAAHTNTLDLITLLDSPPQQVLKLVGLPYRTMNGSASANSDSTHGQFAD